MSWRLAIAFGVVVLLALFGPMITERITARRYVERVDGFYKADRADLRYASLKRDLGSVEACRAWGLAKAAAMGDPDLERGEIVCGIDPAKDNRPGSLAYREFWRSTDQ